MTTPEGRHDLVVVANRLPFQHTDSGWEPSPGGLVRALLPLLRERGGAWVGWTGVTGHAPAPFRHGSLTLCPVPLSTSEHEDFYEQVSNTALWPLYHDAIRPPSFEHESWTTYERVNRRFAEAAALVAAPGALVWVHDYQLQLVPAILRALRPDVRIGFFLHIPFPPQELFMQLPWREQVLRGLLGADIIGFQRAQGAENFAGCARRLLGAQGEPPTLRYGNRQVHVAAHPISIDVDEIDALASDSTTVEAAHRVRELLGCPRRVLLGVDRLDYTKGIEARLMTFGGLLDAGRLEAGDCVLVQIAVPTRGRLDHYGVERKRVAELVGEINGRHGKLGRPAIHYLNRNLPLEEVVALYRAADVMLVTPLRDGMNLVAKEFVASRVDGAGVLVLSEFAGAADELTDALLVNPHDPVALQRAMLRAVELPFAEARRRMARLRAAVMANDVHHWARAFLDLLAVPVAA
jgi:trehalose 6-phosphate synthase